MASHKNVQRHNIFYLSSAYIGNPVIHKTLKVTTRVAKTHNADAETQRRGVGGWRGVPYSGL